MSSLIAMDSSMYSASVIESAISPCFQELQATGQQSTRIAYSDFDFVSSGFIGSSCCQSGANYRST